MPQRIRRSEYINSSRYSYICQGEYIHVWARTPLQGVTLVTPALAPGRADPQFDRRPDREDALAASRARPGRLGFSVRVSAVLAPDFEHRPRRVRGQFSKVRRLVRLPGTERRVGQRQ